jgi:hypothetical protein
MPGTVAAASMAVLGSFTVVAAFTAANPFTRHLAAVDFTRAFMANAFTTTTTFVDLSSSAALRSALG